MNKEWHCTYSFCLFVSLGIGLERSLASRRLNGRPSHTPSGGIRFQRIAALSERDLGNRAKSRGFRCGADGRSLRKAQWKLIHTEISHRAPERKKKGGGGRKVVLSQSTNSGARQKEQSVERSERRERGQKRKGPYRSQDTLPSSAAGACNQRFSPLFSSALLCHPSLSLGPSHHYSLQRRVGAAGEADHQCGS